jgi:hypothetical protein
MCAPHGGCQPDKGFEAEHLDLGKFVDWVWALRAERDQLKSEVEAMRKDAERYRWLKDGEVVSPICIRISDGRVLRDGKADVAIDAAMSGEPGQ